ncbi:MAG TPA: epoxide hydrolase N-terminal domain-containing protein [Vicinamibacterales bacterium]|nr:epoxide hydrolase N-terminal domain-containing protein [Vicinamibacterales bacterium]
MKSLERLTCRVIGIGVIALAALTSVTLSSTRAAADSNDTAIRPFRVNVPKSKPADLQRRLAATRWPTKELVEDRSQGVQLATLKELVR